MHPTSSDHRRGQRPASQSRLGIWHARDVDFPVTITGDLGVGPDGRRYVAVECTRSGIPLDEIELLGPGRRTPEPGRNVFLGLTKK